MLKSRGDQGDSASRLGGLQDRCWRAGALIAFGQPSVEAHFQIFAVVDPEFIVERQRLLDICGEGVKPWSHTGIQQPSSLLIHCPITQLLCVKLLSVWLQGRGDERLRKRLVLAPLWNGPIIDRVDTASPNGFDRRSRLLGGEDPARAG